MCGAYYVSRKSHRCHFKVSRGSLNITGVKSHTIHKFLNEANNFVTTKYSEDSSLDLVKENLVKRSYNKDIPLRTRINFKRIPKLPDDKPLKVP